MFIDDIESMELLLAHALPEGLANLAVPAFVFLAMFFVDWKLALLSLCALPLGLVAMMAMYRAGTSKMGAYYASAQKMNNTIVGAGASEGAVDASNLLKPEMCIRDRGTMATDNLMFMVLLVAVVLIVGALTFFPALALGPIPVSYTHLDVYKRQGRVCRKGRYTALPRLPPR